MMLFECEYQICGLPIERNTSKYHRVAILFTSISSRNLTIILERGFEFGGLKF